MYNAMATDRPENNTRHEQGGDESGSLFLGLAFVLMPMLVLVLVLEWWCWRWCCWRWW